MSTTKSQQVGLVGRDSSRELRDRALRPAILAKDSNTPLTTQSTRRDDNREPPGPRHDLGSGAGKTPSALPVDIDCLNENRAEKEATAFPPSVVRAYETLLPFCELGPKYKERLAPYAAL